MMKKIVSLMLAATLLLCGLSLAGCDETPAKTADATASAIVPTQVATEFNNQARFDSAVAYVEEKLDLTGFEKTEEGGSDALRDTWTNASYAELTLPLTVTVCGYEITLGKTTFKNMLDNGFAYMEDVLNTGEAPFYATMEKNGQVVSFIGNTTAADKDSSVISYLLLVGADGAAVYGGSAAQFDFNGLKLEDDVVKAYSIYGAPNSVEAYSAATGAHAAIHLMYPVADRSLTLSYWYDDNGGTYLNSIEMRYNEL